MSVLGGEADWRQLSACKLLEPLLGSARRDSWRSASRFPNVDKLQYYDYSFDNSGTILDALDTVGTYDLNVHNGNIHSPFAGVIYFGAHLEVSVERALQMLVVEL